MVSKLDEIIDEYKKETPKKERDWRTYEQRVGERLKKAFNEFRPLVKEAVSSIKITKGETRGSASKLDLEQKVLLLLLKHLFGKSNRDMSFMLVVFSWLTDINVSYKTIERLYSDREIELALHNLHILLLKKKNITEVDCGGDSTGYSLTVKKHYATEAQKLKDKLKENPKDHSRRQFVFSFALMDIKTRMYVSYGMSFKSEQEAFLKTIDMLKETNIKIKSLRLDKYYSAQIYVELCQEHLGKVKLYLIPKSNATLRGSWEWKRMLGRFSKNTKGYLKEYYKRNQSESGFSEDKKRIGWKLGQKKPDRINTANTITNLWHNLYWLG